MRGVAALVLGLALAPPAWADDPLPGLYAVSGVAADDVLNVRAAPSAGAEIVGSLAAGTRDVEVTARDASGRWGRVNSGERSGWVALRFLGPGPPVWARPGLPPNLSCFGTEPFWSLALDSGALVFATPDAPEQSLALATVLAPENRHAARRGLIAEAGGVRLTATIAPATCSDGMSDRSFGLEISAILEGRGAARMLTGCCSIAP